MEYISTIEIITMILALSIAIIGHEIMHGIAAFYYGDNTAKNAGRLSLNPLKHIDIIGSIILPAVLFFTNAPFLFGWAKPVPVNMDYLVDKHGYKAGVVVSLAGVSFNFLLAGGAFIFAYIFLETLETNIFSLILILFLISIIQYNMILGIFNLIPIPPLDGSKVLFFASLKLRFYEFAKFLQKIEPFGIFIVMLLLIFVPEFFKILITPLEMLLKLLLI